MLKHFFSLLPWLGGTRPAALLALSLGLAPAAFGQATFAPAATYGVGVTPFSVAVGDFNGDGKPDLATANYFGDNVSVLLGTGTGTFAAAVNYGAGDAPVSVAVGDFNGDGKPDLATANSNDGNVSVLLGTGTGTFAAAVNYGAGAVPYSVAVGDFNGDGKPDLATANANRDNVSVLLGTGTGTFAAAVNYGAGDAPLSVAVGDFNGDGKSDLATANYLDDNVSVLLNTTYTGPLTWTGAVSTDWAIAGNWSPGQVPTVTNDVFIPAAPARQPVVSGDQSARNVDLATGARLTLAADSELDLGTITTVDGSLTLASGSTLMQGAGSEIYLASNLTNNGAIFLLDATSEVAFGGPTHFINGTTGIEFQTMTVGERASYDIVELRVPVRIRRKLGLYQNATTFQGPGGSLTLLSDASGTALIDNDATSVVGGTVTMQRYIDPSLNPGPGYRHYSSPMQFTTVADLDTKATGGRFSPEVSQAQVYNSSETPGKTKPFPTVFGYDQERVTMTSTYKPFDRGFFVPEGEIDNKNAPLETGRGYAVQIAGTEKVDFTGSPFSGSLNVDLFRLAGNADAGWALVGNPYPAPLDGSLLLTDANASGLDQSFYVVESTGPYDGMYRSYVVGFEGEQNPLIASSQGFFVRVRSDREGGQLRFRNAQRVTEFEPQVTMKRGGTGTQPTLALTLRGATGPTDRLFVYADAQATPAFDGAYDAWKLPNTTGLNLSSRTAADQDLSIDGRPVFTTATRIALAVGVPAAGTYTLSAASLTNLPTGLDAYLHDAATGQTLKLTDGTTYSFGVTAAQSLALLTGRFTLSFGASSVLATAPAALAAQVSVYPNPATGRFTVSLPAMAGARTVEATLLNSLGQVVRRQSVSLHAAGTHFDVAAEGLGAGVYSLRLTAGATLLTKRVVLR